MRIGISTWALPWAVSEGLDAPRFLEKAASCGAEVVQFADNLPLTAHMRARQEETFRLARSFGLTVELGLDTLEPDRLLAALSVAREQGVSLIRTLPHLEGGPVAESQAVALLRRVLPSYEAAGVTLALENHDFYPARWLARVVKALDPACAGVCLDPVNSFGRGESFREVVAALGGHTVNFHCKDYAITRRPDKLGFDVTGRACGEGMLDMELAYRRFAGVNWLVELWTAPMCDRQATIREEEARMRRSVAYLLRLRKEREEKRLWTQDRRS